MRSRFRSLLPGLYVLLGALLLATEISAQETGPEAMAGSDAARQPLIFRKEYIPAARIDEFARDTIPLRREQFEEMVAALKGSPLPVQAGTVESCWLAGRMHGNTLAGLGQLEVRQGRASNTYLSLAPCRLPINSVWWIEDFAELPLGYDARGKLGALIDRSGICQFDWSLQGKEVQHGVTEFRLALPKGPFKRMLFVVPDDRRLSVDTGNLRQASESELASWNWWNDVIDEGDTAYLVTTSGSDPFTLRLAKRDEASDSEGAYYRQTNEHELSYHDSRLTTTFEINAGLEQLRRVVVSWPAELQLESARNGSMPLEWRPTESSDDSRRRATVALPPQPNSTNFSLTLRLRGTPAAEENLALPSVRLHGLHWREAKEQVTIRHPLRLSGVAVNQAELLPTESPLDSAGDQRLEFRSFSESATITVATHFPDARLRGQTASLFEFAEQGVRGEFLAKLSCEQGSVFQFNALLGSQWTIDSLEVTSLAESMGKSTDILRDWVVTGRQAEHQTVEVRLNRPLTDTRSLLLRVLASRRGESLEGEIALNQLRPLSLAALTDEHLFAFRAESSRQLRLISPSFARLIEADEFAARLTDIGHFEDTWTSDSLRLGSQSVLPSIRFDLRNAKPRFAATIESQVNVSIDSLVERHRVVCTPQSGNLDRLVVRVGSKAKQPLNWSTEGEENVVLSPRMLHEDMEGAIWELSIYPPRSQAFTLLAERDLPRQETQQLGLLSLTDASSEAGTVTVTGNSPLVSYRLLPSGLLQAPVVGEQPRNLFARFRYQGSDARRLQVISNDASVAPEMYQNWLTQIDTMATTQRVRHVARLHIENRGADHLPITLPANVRLDRVLINGEPVAGQSGAESSSLKLSLPPSERFVLVTLEYDDADRQPWSLWQRIEARAPLTSRAALCSQWHVSIAPDLALWREAQLDSAGQPAAWPAKLFGALIGGNRHAEPTKRSTTVATVGPWALGDRSIPSALMLNWSTTSLAASDGTPNSVTLTYPLSWHVLSIGIVFVSAAVTLLICRNQVSRIVLILGGTAALCLFSAGMCSVAASGLFMGSLLSSVWLGFKRLTNKVSVETVPKEQSHASTASVSPGALASWLTIISIGSLLVGSDRLSQAQPEELRPVFRVFVPVDDDNQPQGNYVHLNDEFYKALHRRFSQHRWPAVGSLLHSANHAIEIKAKEDDQAQYGLAVDVGQYRFEGDISILRSDQPITLPFDRSQVALVDDSALLDGLPVEAVWDANGTALVISPQRLGRFSLELEFVPSVATEYGRDLIDVSVPVAAHARLEISHPADLPELQLASRQPLSRMTTERSVADIGSVGQWKLELPTHAELSRSLAVEQLSWLQLRPGTMIWNVKFRYTPTADAIRWLEWEVDPALRPLAFTTEQAEFGRSTYFPETNRFRLELIEPVAEPFTVLGSFLVDGASGIGDYRQPVIAPVAAQRDRHWLAVTHDRSLVTQVTHGGMVEPLASGEFRTAWGEVDTPPMRAFRVLTSSPDWSITVMPASKPRSINTTTALSVDRSAMLLRYRADVPAESQAASIYQFELPAGYQLQSATIDSLERSLQIIPTIDGNRATLVAPEPLSAAHRISLSLLGPAPEQSFILPEIILIGATEKSTRYEVYRHDNVTVEAEGLEPVVGVATSPAAGTQWGRLAFSAEPPAVGAVQWPPRIMVTPNQPQVDPYQLFVVLQREQDQWQLRIVAEGTVTAGVIDSLRFAVPESLSTPSLVFPSGKLERVDLPFESIAHWVVRPAEPITGPFKIEIGIPLEFEPGSPPALPLIEPVEIQPQATFVVLPRNTEQQESDWTVNNMDRVALPESQLASLEVNQPASTYRANDDYSARMTLAVPETMEPQVRLADVRILAQENRHYFGSISYDLEPGGLSSCELRIPAGVLLQRVLLDEAAVAVSRQDDSPESGISYRCMIGETNLPRRLEVLFSGTSSADSFRLAVPILAEIPVERTLWTIHGPRGSVLSSNGSSTQPIGERRHLAFRLQAAAALAEPPENLLATTSQNDLNSWYAPWATRMSSNFRAGAATAAEPSDYPFNKDFVEDRLETAKRMGVAASFRAAFDNNAATKRWSVPEIADAVESSSREPIYAMSQGAPELIELEVATQSDNALGHSMAALALMVVSIAGYRFVRGRSLSELVVWWLHPLGVVLGIAWCLWLTPAFIGWIIIAIALLGSLRSPWRTTSFD